MTAKEIVDGLRTRFKTIPEPESGRDCCVGGAPLLGRVLWTRLPTPFPTVSHLALAFQVEGMGEGMAEWFAHKIIRLDGEEDYEGAWNTLERALAYTNLVAKEESCVSQDK